MRVKKYKKNVKKIHTTVHLISVHLSSLTIFIFFFFTRCFVLLHFIFIYTSPRLAGEERAKATSRKEIEDYAAKSKTIKISLSTQSILLGVIVAHEPSPDYSV